MTARTLAKLMLAFLKKAKKLPKKRGEQSFKSLAKRGESLADIEISDDNIGTFKKIARKHDIDFNLQRDDTESPPRWVVFFRAKDNKRMEIAFKEYANTILTKQKTKKGSMLNKIAEKNELAKSIPHKVIEHVKDIAGMAR